MFTNSQLSLWSSHDGPVSLLPSDYLERKMTEFLQALASVCEAAPRLAPVEEPPSRTYRPVQRGSRAPSRLQLPYTLQRASSTVDLASSTLAIPLPQTPCSSQPFGAAARYSQWNGPHPLIPLSYGHCLHPYQLPLQPMTTPTTQGYSTAAAPVLPFPSPPPTPTTNTPRFQFPPPGYATTVADTFNSSQNYNQHALPLPPPTYLMAAAPTPSPSPSPSPYFATADFSGANSISHSLFETYLRETWPKDTLRRGGSIIRASLYQQIVSVLLGGDAHGRLKQWIQRSEFFLVVKEGQGVLLAIPTVKSRVSKRAVAAGRKSESRGPHKLVARLEEFYYIIGSYHNNTKGHYGIRKTYGMVSQMH